MDEKSEHYRQALHWPRRTELFNQLLCGNDSDSTKKGTFGMTKRTKVPKTTETEVLLKSGRRCCLCYGLHGDSEVKQGQVAHIDKKPNNNDLSNLAFLCLKHHDEYDSKTSQSKGLTELEVRSHRDKLYDQLHSITSKKHRAGDVSVSADVAAGDGTVGSGGDAIIEGGTGRQGASGGNVTIGPGTYKAGDGGPGGSGGDLVIKGGDAE